MLHYLSILWHSNRKPEKHGEDEGKKSKKMMGSGLGPGQTLLEAVIGFGLGLEPRPNDKNSTLSPDQLDHVFKNIQFLP